jgi:hypothetical protein
MRHLVFLACAVVLALVLITLLKALLSRPRGGAGAGALPYRRKDYLLTKAEREFYEALRAAVEAGGIVVFPKVRLLDLLWFPKGTTNLASHRNRVQSKHVDFVLCDRRALRPLLVVELDDSTHERADRKARDAFVDSALAAAGLPILHVPARASYDPQAVAQQVMPLIAPQLVVAQAR